MTSRQRGQTRSKLQRDTQRARVETLLVTRPRLTLTEIATELGIDRSTASRDVKTIKRSWAMSLTDDQRRVLAGRELATLEAVRAEAFAGWAKSLLPKRAEHVAERTTEVAVGQKEVVGGPKDGARVPDLRPGDSSTLKELRVEESSGDPRYLTVALHATTKVIDLMGLAEPARIRVGAEPGDMAALIEALSPYPMARQAAAAALWGGDDEDAPDLNPVDLDPADDLNALPW